jgi:hypothetical protein
VDGEFDGADEVLGEHVVDAILLGAPLELAHRDTTALGEMRDEVETLPDIDEDEVPTDVTLTDCTPVALSQVVADFETNVEGVAKIVTLTSVDDDAVGREERDVVVESEGIDVESVEAECVCDSPLLADMRADNEAFTLKLCKVVRLLVGPVETVLCTETLSKSGVDEGNDDIVAKTETVLEFEVTAVKLAVIEVLPEMLLSAVKDSVADALRELLVDPEKDCSAVARLELLLDPELVCITLDENDTVAVGHVVADTDLEREFVTLNEVVTVQVGIAERPTAVPQHPLEQAVGQEDPSGQ